jgi:hypothetical protein
MLMIEVCPIQKMQANVRQLLSHLPSNSTLANPQKKGEYNERQKNPDSKVHLTETLEHSSILGMRDRILGSHSHQRHESCTVSTIAKPCAPRRLN